MKHSCAVVISHFESLPFLLACVRQIKKYEHPEIATKIIIVDQSCVETYETIVKEYWYDDQVYTINTKPLYSGFGIDYLLRHEKINTEYICQIHADVLAIHKNWLYLPIKLIEENNFSFVGQLQFISQPTDTIYPPGKQFFAMAQCFNVAKAETYKEMSLEAGFTRFHNRIDSGLTFKNDDWSAWANEDYYNRGSDDDIVAFRWEDQYKEHDKLGLAISGYIEPNFGRIIDDLVFHFCSARESIGVDMGEKYNSYTKRINENYSDELINEMVELAKKNKPNGTEILSRNLWDGKLKECIPIPDELNKRIEELKK